MRRLGIVTDTEHQAVEYARAQVLVMLEERTGPFADADRWASWRWNPVWSPPRLPQREEAGPETVAASR
ncbi:hypothetical protein [Streptomyces sp. Qhu_M48]|uniref:hypothetical protein n=1 Tax=Streptomyces sp. Qhu_M48 TaxID=3435889 RepID=UPI003F4FAB58